MRSHTHMRTSTPPMQASETAHEGEGMRGTDQTAVQPSVRRGVCAVGGGVAPARGGGLGTAAVAATAAPRTHTRRQMAALLAWIIVLLLQGLVHRTAAQASSDSSSGGAGGGGGGGSDSGSGTMSDVPAIPDPLEASWVDLGSIALPDPVWGRPAPRCDHVFLALEGFAAAGDDAPAADDPWKGKWWLFSGHGAMSMAYNDSWILDTALDPPTWTKIEYNNAPDTLSPRFGGAAAFLSHGLDPSDRGLTAVLFGGTTGPSYLNDVVTLNFETRTLRTIVNSTVPAHGENGAAAATGAESSSVQSDTEAPFGRSYFEWHSLPSGYGSGRLDPPASGGSSSPASGLPRPSGSFFLLGGSGTSDGRRFTELDRTLDEEYIFEASKAQWSRFGAGPCLRNNTRCTDRVPLYSYTAGLRAAAADGTLELLVSELRPHEALPALHTLLHRIHTINTTLASELRDLNASDMSDDPGACKTVCTERSFDRGPRGDHVYPPPLEGYRAAEMDGKLFVFGGYKCSLLGTQQLGGDDCFSNSMWVLDYATMLWREIVVPSVDSPLAPFRHFWPSPRAYPVAGAHRGSKIILVQGGAFQDLGGTWYYHNDAYAFDTQLLLFVPLSVRGVPPRLTWSGAGTVASGGDALLVHGGCFGDVFSDQLLSLQVGLVVRASNCHVTGEGLARAIAGRTGVFQIQTRESRPATSGTPNDTTHSYGMVWGKNAPWGTGLALTAQLLSFPSAASSGSGPAQQPILVTVRLTEMGGGLYSGVYAATLGHSMQLFIALNEVPVPGSPFSIHLEPSSTVSAAHTSASGWGTNVTERGGGGQVVIHMADAFGNPHHDTRFLQGGAGSNGGGIRPPGPPGSNTSSPSPSSPSANAEALAAMQSRQSWLDAQGQPLELRAYHGSSVSSLAPLDSWIEHNDDGTFSLSYAVPSHDGSGGGGDHFFLAIQLNNVSLYGSPWTVRVLDPVEVGSEFRVAFQVLTALVLALCAALSGAIYWWRDQALFRSASPAFLQLLVWGSACASLSVLFLTLQSEAVPGASGDASCRAYHCCLSVGLMAGMAALLAKSHRVMRIFNAKKLRVTRGLDDRRLAVPTGAAIGLMLLLNLLWLGVSPLRLVLNPANDFPLVQSFPACEGDDVWIWVGTILALSAIVLVYGIYLAIRTGHVPAQYNESKLIAASVYNQCFCLIIVIPLLLFLGNDSSTLTGRLVVQATVILWCAAFNVLAVCGPKVVAQMRTTKPAPPASGGVGAGADGQRQTPTLGSSATRAAANPSLANAALSAAASTARTTRPIAASSAISPFSPSSGQGAGAGASAASKLPRLPSPQHARAGASTHLRPLPTAVVPKRISTTIAPSPPTGSAAPLSASATSATTAPVSPAVVVGAAPLASPSDASGAPAAPPSRRASGSGSGSSGGGNGDGVAANPPSPSANAVRAAAVSEVEVELQPVAQGAVHSSSPSPSPPPSRAASILTRTPAAATLASPSRLNLLLRTALEADPNASLSASPAQLSASQRLSLSSSSTRSTPPPPPQTQPQAHASSLLADANSGDSTGGGGGGGVDSPILLSPSARPRISLLAQGGESTLSFVARLQRTRASVTARLQAESAAPQSEAASASSSASTADHGSAAP